MCLHSEYSFITLLVIKLLRKTFTAYTIMKLFKNNSIIGDLFRWRAIQTESFVTKNGVRCILSPLLIDAYSEYITRQVPDEWEI